MALQTQKFARTEISAQISAIRNRQNQVFKKRKSRFSFLTLRCRVTGVPTATALGNQRPYGTGMKKSVRYPWLSYSFLFCWSFSWGVVV